MLFNVALFSSLLLAPVVLAVPSELGAHIARLRAGVNNRRNAADAAGLTTNSTTWAGAVYAEANKTFNHVTATFTAPTFSGQNGTGAAFLLGIDGYTCTSSLFQAGVAATVASEGSEATYSAWYQWVPTPAYEPSGIIISAGDDIKLTLVASSAHSGTATIENLTNGQHVSESLNSSAPLCGQNVRWSVGEFVEDGSRLALADFGEITFRDARATGPTGKVYTPEGTSIVELVQNDTVLTNVSTTSTSVTIQYQSNTS